MDGKSLLIGALVIGIGVLGYLNAASYCPQLMRSNLTD